jgi:hypothetical protein
MQRIVFLLLILALVSVLGANTDKESADRINAYLATLAH